MKTGYIRWLAGFLEGEGSFNVHHPNGYRTPRLAINHTDKDVLEKVAKILGSHVQGPHEPYKENYRQQWSIYITGRLAASWMMTLYGLMGERRQKQIEEVLLIW